jgi:hypothetical protein
MLSDFQQALAELTAFPDLCLAVRQDATVLGEKYSLTDRERRQLLAVVHHPSMECACSLYRADRLAPLLRNLPRSLQSLGGQLETEVTAYWRAHPWPYRYSFLECERFERWLEPLSRSEAAPAGLAAALQEEGRQMRDRMQSFLEACGMAIAAQSP